MSLNGQRRMGMAIAVQALWRVVASERVPEARHGR